VAGAAVKQAAYDVQHQAWSKGPIANRAARLAQAKALSKPMVLVDDKHLDRVMVGLSEPAPRSYRGAETPMVDNALTLAALAILGHAGDANEGEIQPLLGDENTGWCVKMAKLNYFQCLSVAGPHYEDIYCLGKHAIGDTAQCVVEAASLGTLDVEAPRRKESGLVATAERTKR
jgi:hypothetical protein